VSVRTRLALATLAVALLPGVAAHAQVEAIEPTFQLDRKRDVRGPLDIVRVAMSTRIDGSLRGELTMRRGWEAADLDEGGSLCLRLYVKTDPESQAPEYLVCATRAADGETLTGRVLRNRAGGLPRTAGAAVVGRPTARTIHLGFDPSAIRSPAQLRFVGESAWRGARCPRTTGCADLAPDAPDAREFRLRRNSASG
jgi:hypothetical protein